METAELDDKNAPIHLHPPHLHPTNLDATTLATKVGKAAVADSAEAMDHPHSRAAIQLYHYMEGAHISCSSYTRRSGILYTHASGAGGCTILKHNKMICKLECMLFVWF